MVQDQEDDFELSSDAQPPKESFLRGIQNQPLVLSKKQNNKTQKTDYNLTKDDCKRLLREYPELKSAYELFVRMEFNEDNQASPDNEESKSVEDGRNQDVEMIETNKKNNVKLMSNQEFWKEFLENNLRFQTEPFRGNNPVFIPRVTDPKEYEDRYIHNQQ